MSTYYVSAATGNDADSGATEALAWLTIDKAMNTVIAGDKVWVKADGNYAELATVDTVGTPTAPVVFEGYTTTTGDGGRATITGSSTRANCVASNVSILSTTRVYYIFKNFRMTAATAEGFLSIGQNYTFKNCKFDTNGTAGLQARSILCEACEFSANGTRGCNVQAGLGVFVGCQFYDNGTVGLEGNVHLVIVSCIFFSNGSQAMSIGSTNLIAAVINCTIDGDAKDSTFGIEFNTPDAFTALVNNVVYDCGTGISDTNGDGGELVISRNNLVNSNTTAYTNAATFTGEITSAPQFVDEVAGADYHPATGSPLIDAGYDGGVSMAIGAVQPVTQSAMNVFKLRIGV